MPEPTFSQDPGFDFAVRCVLSGCRYAMADPGEVLATASEVAPGDCTAWFRAWTALGERCDDIGDRSAAAGHRVSAHAAHLRAANYRFAGWYYVLGSEERHRHVEAWRAHRRSLTLALAELPGARPARWSCGGEEFPAVVVDPPQARAGRPALVVLGGLASPLSDGFMTGVADALDRGWTAIMAEGPGHGAPWFQSSIGPVDHWAPYGRALVDLAVSLPGVAPTRVAVSGVSDGAFLAVQAAGDPRVAALVCDPGVVRPLDGALGQLPTELQAAWRERRREFDAVVDEARRRDASVDFVVRKLTEQWPEEEVGAVLDRMAGWDAAGPLGSVACPALVTDAEDQMSFPGQAEPATRALGGPATLVRFGREEGAGLDCEIGAPLLRNQRVFDWLEDTVLASDH